MTITLAPPGIRLGPKSAPAPQLTIGNEGIEWCERLLLQPDGPLAGQPWRFTREQIRFLLNWYAIDESGRFVYRYGVLRRMKGWGKDPFGAALCALEFVGPCRFAGFAENGIPLAEPHHSAWVQTAAVAKDQTKNMMTLFPAMFSAQLIDEYEIDMGKEIIYAHHARCRIECVTSSPRALEGGRATFIIKDETHHWLQANEGHGMDDVIARNAAKSRDGASRALAITNAHNPGEDSVAERDYEAWVKIDKGLSRASGFLYDCLEAPPDTKLAEPDSLRAGLEAARGDSTWLDIPRLMQEIYDPRTMPSIARRYYLNQIVAAEDAWVAPHEWDERVDTKKMMDEADEVTLGFDGSKTDDHTALVGCRVKDSFLFTLGLWDPAAYSTGEIPRLEIDRAVKLAMEKFAVVGFFSDVHPWESYVDSWEEAYGQKMYVHSNPKHPIAWDMRGRTREGTLAAEALHAAIIEGDISHSGDRRASQHVYNARRRPNQYGVTFGKEQRESPRKVDWLAAAMLARLARQQYMMLPESKKRKKRTGKAMFV